MTYIVSGQMGRQAYPSIPSPPITAGAVTNSLLLFFDNRYGGGSSSVAAYMHDQISAQLVWTINHNLGYKPQIQSYSPGGVEIFGDVLQVSDNQATITFASAQSGFARCI